jgi:hypothetical protein
MNHSFSIMPLEVNHRFPASAAMMSGIGQALARNGIPYITPSPAIFHEEAGGVLNAPVPAPVRCIPAAPA